MKKHGYKRMTHGKRRTLERKAQRQAKVATSRGGSSW